MIRLARGNSISAPAVRADSTVITPTSAAFWRCGTDSDVGLGRRSQLRVNDTFRKSQLPQQYDRKITSIGIPLVGLTVYPIIVDLCGQVLYNLIREGGTLSLTFLHVRCSILEKGTSKEAKGLQKTVPGKLTEMKQKLLHRRLTKEVSRRVLATFKK